MSTIDKQLQIISAIKANDEVVLNQLYVSNFKKIELFVLKNNGSTSQAKDLYQETFIQMWENVRKNKFLPKNNRAIEGYIFKIARNKWMDYLRSKQFKKTYSLIDDARIEKKPEMEPDPFEESQRLEITRSAFKQLGQACKQLLVSFYFNKKSMRTIANELQIDEASARNKKYRCIQKLREIALSSPKSDYSEKP